MFNCVCTWMGGKSREADGGQLIDRRSVMGVEVITEPGEGQRSHCEVRDLGVQWGGPKYRPTNVEKGLDQAGRRRCPSVEVDHS